MLGTHRLATRHAPRRQVGGVLPVGHRRSCRRAGGGGCHRSETLPTGPRRAADPISRRNLTGRLGPHRPCQIGWKAPVQRGYLLVRAAMARPGPECRGDPMSLCADAQALTFVPTQAIGRVHATAAEAVARAPEALLMWTAPEPLCPLARPRARGPGLRAVRRPCLHCRWSTPTHREEVPNARTPGRSVSTSFGQPVSPGPPALPGAGSARRMHQTTGTRIPEPTWSPTGIP